MSISKQLAAIGFGLVLASCQTTVQENGGDKPVASNGDIGFQNVRKIREYATGKSFVPVGNGLAFYLADDGVLHSKHVFHHDGPAIEEPDGNYSYGRAKNSVRPALQIGDTVIPKAPALCTPRIGLLGYPVEGKFSCLTLFLLDDGSVYAPEYDTIMVVTDGSGAFQSVIHNEGRLRDIPPPVPAYYGNIKKYGGITPEYLKRFPNDLEAQQISSEFRLYLAQAKAQSDAELKAELAAIEKKYDEKWAREDREKIAAAKRASDAKKRKAAADRAAREQKCRAETGSACSSGGGMIGWMLSAGLGALETASSGVSSGGAASYPTEYELVCREKIDLNFDNWRKGPTYSCSGYSGTCEDEFKARLQGQYGSLNAACHANHGVRFDYDSIE